MEGSGLVAEVSETTEAARRCESDQPTHCAVSFDVEPVILLFVWGLMWLVDSTRTEFGRVVNGVEAMILPRMVSVRR